MTYQSRPWHTQTVRHCTASAIEYLGLKSRSIAVPAHGQGNGHLVPEEDAASGEGDLFYLGIRGMVTLRGRIAVEEHEFMPGAKLQERLEELPGVDPDASTMLVVVS